MRRLPLLSACLALSTLVPGTLALGACAASPLYKGNDQGVTPGPVPRDANGEPVLPSPASKKPEREG